MTSADGCQKFDGKECGRLEQNCDANLEIAAEATFSVRDLETAVDLSEQEVIRVEKGLEVEETGKGVTADVEPLLHVDAQSQSGLLPLIVLLSRAWDQPLGTEVA